MHRSKSNTTIGSGIVVGSNQLYRELNSEQLMADSCYEEAQTTDVEELESGGWVVGKMVGPLTNGLLLYEGCCPYNS